METTGQPLRIHASDSCHHLLSQLGGYTMEERGEVAVKGKGSMLTYWLVGEDPVMGAWRKAERDKKKQDHFPSTQHGFLRSLSANSFRRHTSHAPDSLRFGRNLSLEGQNKRLRWARHGPDNNMADKEIIPTSPPAPPYEIVINSPGSASEKSEVMTPADPANHLPLPGHPDYKVSQIKSLILSR